MNLVSEALEQGGLPQIDTCKEKRLDKSSLKLKFNKTWNEMILQHILGSKNKKKKKKERI